MRVTLLFGLAFHWGEPINRTEIRAWTGTLGYKPADSDKSQVRHDYISHKIERWYGFTYKRSGFFGICRFGVTTTERSENLPSYVPREDRAQWEDYDKWPLEKEEDITDD